MRNSGASPPWNLDRVPGATEQEKKAALGWRLIHSAYDHLFSQSESNRAVAVQKLRYAHELGTRQATLCLGWVLFLHAPLEGFPLLAALHQESPDAYTHLVLGWMYALGCGCDQNLERSVEYLRAASGEFSNDVTGDIARAIGRLGKLVCGFEAEHHRDARHLCWDVRVRRYLYSHERDPTGKTFFNDRCSLCKEPAPARCECRAVRYCSEACQKEHWYKAHKPRWRERSSQRLGFDDSGSGTVQTITTSVFFFIHCTLTPRG